jgi:hypothetical protein
MAALRASPAGRSISDTESVRFGPYRSVRGQPVRLCPDGSWGAPRDEARKKYDWGQLYNIFVTLGSFFINRPKLAMISERFATFHWGQLTPMRMRQLRPCVQQFCIFSSLEVKQAHLVCRSEIC